MSYVQSTLLENESILHEAKMSLWAFGKPIAVAVACFIAAVYALSSDLITFGTWLLAVPPNVALYVWLVRGSTEMAVTNMRVLIKSGVVKRDTWELYLTRIEGVEVDQSVWGRLLNFGDIRVRGVGTEIAPVRAAAGPLAFRKAVFEAGAARGVNNDH